MRAYLIAEISKPQSAKAQCQAIKRAIQIAQYCVSYNNFNTTIEILSALFSPVIIDPKKAKVWEVRSASFQLQFCTSRRLTAADAEQQVVRYS